MDEELELNSSNISMCCPPVLSTAGPEQVQHERRRRNGDKERYIESVSQCKLTPNQKYTLSTDPPDAHTIKPNVMVLLEYIADILLIGMFNYFRIYSYMITLYNIMLLTLYNIMLLWDHNKDVIQLYLLCLVTQTTEFQNYVLS